MNVKQAYESYRKKRPIKHGWKQIQQKFLPLKLTVFFWQFFHNKLSTEDNLKSNGVRLASVCRLCLSPNSEENRDHLFWKCSSVRFVWEWCSIVLKKRLVNFRSVMAMLQWVFIVKPVQQYRQVIMEVVCVSLWEIWRWRNEKIFGKQNWFVHRVIEGITRSVRKMGFLFDGGTGNSIEERAIRRFFYLKERSCRQASMKEVIWRPPPPGWYKVNIDGAAKGLPGAASCGGIFRMYRGFITGCFAMPLEEKTSMHAEIMGFIRAVELATVKNWFPLWVELDSMVLVLMVNQKRMDVPWQLMNSWWNAMKMIEGKQVRVSHIHMEGNYIADGLAGKGLELTDFTWWYRIPRRADAAYERNLFMILEHRVRF